MRRFTRRPRAKSAYRFQPRTETLEARLYLTCDLQMLDDGTLQITGDDTAEVVEIVDRGNGEVSVICQDRDGDRVRPRIFSGVTGIKGDLKGGDDVLHYSSVQDVNAALPQLEFQMGEGNDRANVEVTVSGTPDRPRGFGFVTMGDAGDDSLNTRITSLTRSDDPTQPEIHGEMHGGAGRDEMTLISSTSTGGFTLTSKERSASGPPTTSQPDCLIWDLIDESTGQVDAHAMGSEADQLIELRTDQRGIGRSNFDFVLDGGGGVNALNSYLTFAGDTQGALNGSLQMSHGTETRLEINGAVDLVATSSSQQYTEVEWTYIVLDPQTGSPRAAATLDIVGSTGRDDVNVRIGDNRLSSLAINVDTLGGNDTAVVLLRGEIGNRVDIALNGGGGNDRLAVDASNAPIHAGGALNVSSSGQGGHDQLSTIYTGRNDGRLDVHQSGGRGRDRVGALLRIADGSRGDVVARVFGDRGNDLLALGVFGRPFDPNRQPWQLRFSGGSGYDRCFATDNVFAEGCERDGDFGLTTVASNPFPTGDGTTEHFFTVVIQEDR